MNADRELDAWRAAWRGPAPEPATSPAAARSADLRYRLLAVGEYGVGVLLLAGSLLYAATSSEAALWAWAATVWLLAVPALILAVRLRRGLWQAADTSVRGHVELELRRHRYALRATRYGFALLAVTIVANGAWVIATARSAPAAARLMLADTLVLAALVALGLTLYARRARRRLAAFEALARGLDQWP